MAIGEVFVSHTHADADIADALNEAITRLFDGMVATSYSTNKELSGGIKPGEDWFRWIVERVRSADVAVILLTPASVQKPWVLWEAGAVYGAGLSSADPDIRKVRPLIFKLSTSEVPSPFSGIQGASGDEPSGIERFLRDLIVTFKDGMGFDSTLRAGERLHGTVESYMLAIERSLRNAPLLPTEATVQEWCDRLDRLTSENRMSEVEHVNDWLNLTFGRDRDESPLPIDLRLHRRLGDAYRAANRPDRAVTQFSMALEFAPRDIFLLRSLGLAYLDANRDSDAARIVNRIEELDADAYRRNAECAGLKGRLLRKRGDLTSAAATYREALNWNPDSYYLADILGQTLLRLNRVAEATEAYRQANTIIERLPERNIWTHATQANAALLIGDERHAMEHLANIASVGANPDDLKRIEDGLERIQTGLGLDGGALTRWRVALTRTT